MCPAFNNRPTCKVMIPSIYNTMSCIADSIWLAHQLCTCSHGDFYENASKALLCSDHAFMKQNHDALASAHTHTSTHSLARLHPHVGLRQVYTPLKPV